jgi:hypothetical protein
MGGSFPNTNRNGIQNNEFTRSAAVGVERLVMAFLTTTAQELLKFLSTY